MALGNGNLRHRVSGAHKAQLISEALHAAVVLFVVTCATVVNLIGHNVPADVLGTVYGGAIGYTAGRAGPVSRVISGISSQAPPET